ncbi:hypothetical protein ACJ6WD_35590 [Streptomyces sp. VTCC 41912]|uniref:hypothetical protein n=1 Tax=Streptomyces sp. VTCC 41912 TaxID=3383243 RepID=UPI003896D790
MPLDPDYERAHAKWRQARAELATARSAYCAYPVASDTSQRAQAKARFDRAKRAEAQTRAALNFPWEKP